MISLLAFSACSSKTQNTADPVVIAEASMRQYLADWLDPKSNRSFVTFCDFTQIGVSTEEIKQRLSDTSVIIKDRAKATKDKKNQTWDSELEMNGEIVILKNLNRISESEAEITLIYGGAPTYSGQLVYILRKKHGRWAVYSQKTNRISYRKTTEPNQSLQTMTTAVTDCAAHTPRQPECVLRISVR
jgi:hypothetical protein